MIVTLPYPHKFAGVTFTRNRKIGFEFTNLAMFMWRENTGVTNSEQMEKWIKEKGQAKYLNSYIYAAAQAHCMINRLKQNFTEASLIQSIALAPEETQKKIMETYLQSCNVKQDENAKKKVTK